MWRWWTKAQGFAWWALCPGAAYYGENQMAIGYPRSDIETSRVSECSALLGGALLKTPDRASVVCCSAPSCTCAASCSHQHRKLFAKRLGQHFLWDEPASPRPKPKCKRHCVWAAVTATQKIPARQRPARARTACLGGPAHRL
jgi:hypothetical protein